MIIHSDSGSDDLGAQKTQRLVELVRATEVSFWEIGDLVFDLIETEGKTLGELSELTGWRPSRLSIYANTCKAYPKDVRDYSRDFYDYEKTRAASDRIARQAQKQLAQNPPPEVAEVLKGYVEPNYLKNLEFITELEAKPVAKNSKTGTVKFVTKKFDKRDTTNALGRVVYEAKKAVVAPVAISQHPILNRAFHSSNEALLQKWHDDKMPTRFKLIGLDPPYGTYDKHKDGHLDQGTSAAMFLGADNITEREAIRTTCSTIRLLPKFLATGGTVLLWQSCDVLRRPILFAIERAGLRVEICLVWKKKAPQPSDFTHAWTRQSEFCYVLKRKGEDLLQHDDSLSRSNILEHWFEGPANAIDGCHWWRKPASLMEFLVRKSTNEGDSVLDLYGCTGSLSKAAAKLNRSFVYCESSEQNFQEYSPTVLAEFKPQQEAA